MKLFAEKYPGLNFSTIPYLEVRDHKGTSGFRRALYFAVAGIPLLAIGIGGLMIISRRMKQSSEAS